MAPLFFIFAFSAVCIAILGYFGSKQKEAKKAKPAFKLADSLPDDQSSRRKKHVVAPLDDSFDMFAADPAPVMEPAIAAARPSPALKSVDFHVPAYVRKGVKLSF